MIGQWLPRRQASPPDLRVESLTVADVARLDLGWRSAFTGDELRRHLRQSPSRSFWMPATREYVIGGHWRHRRAVGSLVELGAQGDHRAPLVEALLAACAAEACPLVIFSDTSETRQPRWYQEMGFELVQDIIVYELHGQPAPLPSQPPRLFFEPVTDPALPDLLALDHAAFPYLWWNSEDEFANYLDQTGVQIMLGRDEADRPVTYAGLTFYHGWGHLDRLAVAPDQQGRGYGVETLAYAVERIYATGARRIGLSTQADNHRSQVLYERFGFRRGYRTDYRIYGHWLLDEPAARQAILSPPRA